MPQFSLYNSVIDHSQFMDYTGGTDGQGYVSTSREGAQRNPEEQTATEETTTARTPEPQRPLVPDPARFIDYSGCRDRHLFLDYVEAPGPPRQPAAVPRRHPSQLLANHHTESQSLPKIHVSVGGKTHWALLDTGATHNFAAASVARKFRPSTVLQVGIAATGSVMPILGQARLTIGLEGMDTPEDFLVANDLSHPIILGNPWLTNNAVHLDY